MVEGSRNYSSNSVQAFTRQSALAGRLVAGDGGENYMSDSPDPDENPNDENPNDDEQNDEEESQ